MVPDKPAVMTTAELDAFLRAEFPQAAHMRVDAVTPAGLALRLTPRDGDLRPGGSLSGAAIFGLADVAVYLAILSRIGARALTVTTNASIDYMRKPGPGADLLAEVRLLKLGRVLAVGDALIRSEGQREPCARATMTFSMPPKLG